MSVTSTTCTEQIDDSEIPKLITRLEPPAPSTRKLESPFLFVLQVVYFALILVPVTVYAVIQQMFFTKRKCLKGKVVLVTGSGRGLGQGFALKFAKLGCKVACVDIDDGINQETVQMINQKYPAAAKSYTCNISMTNEIAALKKSVNRDFGVVDILVHNAGVISGAPITQFDDVYVHGIIAVNLTSHFFLIREFLPDMLKRNEGHIVAVSSIAGFGGLAKGSIYVATKHGVVGLMEALHYELQEIPGNKVQTSVVCPWFVNTSALYTKFWNLRVPELSISETINAAVDGIRRNKRVITVPSYLYFIFHFFKLFPDQVTKIMRDIFYVKLTLPPMEFQKTFPLYRQLVNSMRNMDLGFDKC